MLDQAGDFLIGEPAYRQAGAIGSMGPGKINTQEN